MNNNQVSIREFHRVSQASEKLEEFYKALTADENMEKILCDPDSYINETNLSYSLNKNLFGGFSIDVGTELLGFCNNFAKEHNFFSGGTLSRFACTLGKNILKSNDKGNDEIKDSEGKYKTIIDSTIRELTSIKLLDILSCSDFMNILNGDNNSEGK